MYIYLFIYSFVYSFVDKTTVFKIRSARMAAIVVALVVPFFVVGCCCCCIELYFNELYASHVKYVFSATKSVLRKPFYSIEIT